MKRRVSRISWGLVLGLCCLFAGCAAETKPMEALAATIEVLPRETPSAELSASVRVANRSDRTVAILNPDMGVPAPAMKWPWSNEVYRTSLLISFGYLSMSVIDETTGHELPRQSIQTWATPVLRPEITLEPGESLQLAIPLGNFFQLASGHSYQVAIAYGDDKLRVSARTRLTVP